MEAMVPGLRANVLALAATLRGVVFFVCVAGLMLQVNAGRNDLESLTRPLVRAVVVIGLVATLPWWFEFAEKTLLSTANVIEEGYTEHPMRASTALRDTVQDSPSTFSLRRVGESIYRGVLWAAAKLIVLIGSLLQLPFLLLQYILKLLCYLFLPIALALFMVPSLASLGVRYIQQTLAVLAWPVGFAVTELVASHLATAYYTNVATAAGLAPGQLDTASLASMLGGLLGALWLIVGTIGTPLLMQMLFCSGAPISGGGQSALQQLYMIQQLAWMAKSVKSMGAAAPVAAGKLAGDAGKSGGDGGAGGMGGPPPGSPPPTPPKSPPPAPDPTGDKRAASVLASARLPAPHTTI